jgi:hypothetical protein
MKEGNVYYNKRAGWVIQVLSLTQHLNEEYVSYSLYKGIDVEQIFNLLLIKDKKDAPLRPDTLKTLSTKVFEEVIQSRGYELLYPIQLKKKISML